ncbi:MAG: hypothetical protein VX951_05960 [Planctomycetota bacterium]|nr:hypothetical protein [Planctomycetota bacterium]
MTTVRPRPLEALQGASYLLALVLLAGCGTDTPPRETESSSGPKAADPDTSDKIERFSKWRKKPAAPVAVTCHGFLTGSWFHPDGLMHYFVSELLSYDIPLTDAERFQTCEASERHAKIFRTRVRELVTQWPEGPTVGSKFGEQHLTLDGNRAESQLQEFLDHRRSDKVRIHRLWIH